MAWRDTARWYGAALTVLTFSVVGTVRPASAQEIERTIAGVRLGAKGTTILAKYGNPNQVVIGDIAVRQPLGGGAAGGGAGPNSMESGNEGGPGGLPGFPGAPSFPGGGKGTQAGRPGAVTPAMGGAGGQFGGPSGQLSGVPGGGGGGREDGQGGQFGGSGSFGETVSPLAHEQEVTWVYNRKVGNNVVSYEFLIGPSGEVSQIVVTGYSGGNARTRKGIVLGSTYKDVVRVYGYPEEHQQVGDILIASYRNKGHVSFQFLTQHGVVDPYTSGYKVVAITIATVE